MELYLLIVYLLYNYKSKIMETLVVICVVAYFIVMGAIFFFSSPKGFENENGFSLGIDPEDVAEKSEIE